jgi:ribosome-associated protein
MIEFKIKGAFIHLNQLLKALAWVSNGAEANEAIDNKLVRVNDNIELRKRNKIRAGDKISYKQQTATVI